MTQNEKLMLLQFKEEEEVNSLFLSSPIKLPRPISILPNCLCFQLVAVFLYKFANVLQKMIKTEKCIMLAFKIIKNESLIGTL